MKRSYSQSLLFNSILLFGIMVAVTVTGDMKYCLFLSSPVCTWYVLKSVTASTCKLALNTLWDDNFCEKIHKNEQQQHQFLLCGQALIHPLPNPLSHGGRWLWCVTVLVSLAISMWHDK
jgi:hypothetical protein